MITRSNFVNEYARVNGISKKQARAEIERFEDTYKNAVIEHGGVDLRGFIKAVTIEVPAKTLKNPKTQEEIVVPAHKTIKIRVSKKFRNPETKG